MSFHPSSTVFLLAGLVLLAISGFASATFYQVSVTYLDSKCTNWISYDAEVVSSCNTTAPPAECSGSYIFKKNYCSEEFPTGKFGGAFETFSTTSCQPGTLKSRSFTVAGCYPALIAYSRVTCEGDRFEGGMCTGADCSAGCVTMSTQTISDSTSHFGQLPHQIVFIANQSSLSPCFFLVLACTASKKSRCTSAASQVAIAVSVMFTAVFAAVLALIL